jgi:integrase
MATGTAAGTIRLREHYVRRFGRDSRTSPLFADRDDIIEWLGSMRHWMPETRKSARDALVAFFTWAHGTPERPGWRPDNPATGLGSISVPPADPRPANPDEVAVSLRAAEPRVWLMLMLGAVEGMRRAEITVADTRDLRGNLLQIEGKGRRRRQVPLPDLLVRAIRDIEAERGPGPLFPNPLTGQPMTPGHVGRLMSRALPAGTTPHQLRHLAASDLWERGVPIEEIQLLLGHASIITTKRYTAVTLRLVPTASSAAADRLVAS